MTSEKSTNFKEFFIIDAFVVFLPSNLDDFFPNLTRLEVKNSSLEEVNQIELKRVKMLTILDLSNNKLKTLEKNLFKFNKQLIVIRLHGNFLKIIHPKIFDSLENLQELQIHNNLCIREDVRSLKLMIVEVKKNCTEHKTSSLISNLNPRGAFDGADVKMKMMLFCVIGGLIVAIIVSKIWITMKEKQRNKSYDVSREDSIVDEDGRRSRNEIFMI